MTAWELHQQLDLSDGKTPVLLDIYQGVRVYGAKNKFKNGFAISLSGISGKYSIGGCRDNLGFNLGKAIEDARAYIDKWGIK